MGAIRTMRRAAEKLGSIKRVRRGNEVKWIHEQRQQLKGYSTVERGEGKREITLQRRAMGGGGGGVYFLSAWFKRLLGFDAMNDRHSVEDKLRAEAKKNYPKHARCV